MVVVEMESIIFRRNTRKGGRCMRGGRPLNKQIANLTKSIDYLTNRIRKPEYRRQIATNTAQIEKQTKERERLRQQQRLAATEQYALIAAANAKRASNDRIAKETARVAKENANKQRAINNAARNARIAATEQYALNAAANAKIASNARAAKENARVAAENADKQRAINNAARANANAAKATAATSAGPLSALASAMGLTQSPPGSSTNSTAAPTNTAAVNASRKQLENTITKARTVINELTKATNTASATLTKGGNRRNRRTRRK